MNDIGRKRSDKLGMHIGTFTIYVFFLLSFSPNFESITRHLTIFQRQLFLSFGNKERAIFFQVTRGNKIQILSMEDGSGNHQVCPRANTPSNNIQLYLVLNCCI